MPRNDSIGSPFSRQPSVRSPKLRIYEKLFLLNESIDYVVALLRGMEKLPFAEKESLQSAVVEIEEVRCDVNANFSVKLADGERFDEGRFWKQRRDFDKKWRDPDDVYVDVQRREEARKKQGLPPRVGILPHSAVAEEERHWEAQERNTRARKRSSNASARARARS